ncbi:Jasmonate O-methyltransferase [Hordeum vulgare]|nr:Jasmonate O-methyltransferase [Hordeum vulgare]
MWSSGRDPGGGSEPEHKWRVCLDAARKRGSRRWTNRGILPPASFRRSKTEEYDRRRASSSSGSGLLPVKREWSEDEEEPEERAVKEEPEEPASLGRRGVVGPEDYGADVDAVAAAIAERSVREEAECRCHAEELEDLEWRQAVAANLAAKKKHEEWHRIREEQTAKYIDLCSSGEED